MSTQISFAKDFPTLSNLSDITAALSSSPADKQTVRKWLHHDSTRYNALYQRCENRNQQRCIKAYKVVLILINKKQKEGK